MKLIPYLSVLAILFLLSCRSSRTHDTNSGKVITQRNTSSGDSTLIKGAIYELASSEKLIISDIWIKEQRFACDANGNFNISLTPGKYKIIARSIGFSNLTYTVKMGKGEIVNLSFYLVPAKDIQPRELGH